MNLVALGSNNNIVESHNTTVGYCSQNTGRYNVVIGTFSFSDGSNNTVTGSNNTVTGNNNTVTGTNNNVNGHNNTVTGSNNYIIGDNNVVVGCKKGINQKIACSTIYRRFKKQKKRRIDKAIDVYFYNDIKNLIMSYEPHI